MKAHSEVWWVEDAPIELVDEDGAEGLFTVGCASGLDLEEPSASEFSVAGTEGGRTDSWAAGMSCARRSLRVGWLAAEEANRAERAMGDTD